MVTEAGPEERGGQQIGEEPHPSGNVDQRRVGERRQVTGGVITGAQVRSHVRRVHDDRPVSGKLSRNLVSQKCWQYLAGCVHWPSS